MTGSTARSTTYFVTYLGSDTFLSVLISTGSNLFFGFLSSVVAVCRFSAFLVGRWREGSIGTVIVNDAFQTPHDFYELPLHSFFIVAIFSMGHLLPSVSDKHSLSETEQKEKSSPK